MGDDDGQRPSDAAESAKARALFDACDDDGDGLMSRADLEASLRRLAGHGKGSRALLATYDGDGDGSLEYSEFVAAMQSSNTPGTSSTSGREDNCSEYFKEHGLANFLVQMGQTVDKAQPADPYTWMMEYIAKHRHQKADPSKIGAKSESDQSISRVPKSARRIRINTSAVLRKTPKKLLDLILGEAGYEAVESPADVKSDIYFTWDSKAFLQRLGHPSCTSQAGCGLENFARLPPGAWINRLPGMGHLCDKVNMALALRLLQKLWPEKFRFWPKSWLLPNETDQLKRWLGKYKGASGTVIVKPADGSLGEGIFLAQSTADLDSKLLARPNWGAGFVALAQKYLPDPLLIGGLKFDLRLYVVVTCTNPLSAYLCREGLARFCTTKYEQPTQANANLHYMHLTNFSVNKKSAGFVKATDPFDVDSQASKRPLSTLLRQIEVQEAAQGRTFDEAKFFGACEEVCSTLLQSLAPVLNVTYDRVAKESKPKAKVKAKGKAKAKARSRKKDDSSEEEEESEENSEEEEDAMPSCFQVLGVDVLLDEKLQPWLLEVNGRPSMDIEEPVRMAEAPEGMRRCCCRDMDGDEHVHLTSKVDVHVKTTAMRGAFEIVLSKGTPQDYIELDFEKHGPAEDLEGTLQLIARLYQVAGGAEKAFTTYGLRKALAAAIQGGLSATDLDSAVQRWKHGGYRQSGELEKDTAEIGVLDFAGLLQEVAMLGKNADEEDPLDALSTLIQDCDPD